MTSSTAQTLVIDGWLPPQVSNGSRQKHWATVRREVEQTKTMAWASAKHAGWRLVEGKVRMTVVFVFPVKRRRDTDNTVIRAKHLIDGLKPFFRDDSTDWLELHVQAEVVPGHKETRITLEAVEDQ